MKAGHDNALVAWSEVEKAYSARVVNQHERTTILMHVGASFGPCSLISAAVMVAAHFFRANFPDDSQMDLMDFWVVTGVLFFYGLFMVGYSRRKLKHIGDQRLALLKRTK